MGRRVFRTVVGAAIAGLLTLSPVRAQEPDEAESRRILETSTELVSAGKLAEALKWLEDAEGKIAKDDLWLWWGRRGAVHDRLGQFKRALACFDKAIETNSRAWFYDDRAEIHHFYGRWDLARADLKNARENYKARGQPFPKRAAILEVVVDGPFRRDYPAAWRKCDTRSKYGHFQVCSNATLTEEFMDALEKRCARLDPAKPGDLKKLTKLCKPSTQATSVATLMELVRKEYMTLVNMKKTEWPEGRIFKVFYFEDSGDFAAFNARMGDPKSETMAGYYDPNFRYLALYNRPGGDQAYGFSEATLNTFFHEAWHQFYHLLSEDPPIWLNEGLAVFMGPSQLLGGGRKIKLGGLMKRSPNPRAVSRYEQIKEAVRKRTYVPFKKFFRIDEDAWHAGDRHLYYSEGWAICYYALRGRNAAFRKDFLKLFWETTKNRPQNELIDEIFPDARLRAYEKAWLKYMKKL